MINLLTKIWQNEPILLDNIYKLNFKKFHVFKIMIQKKFTILNLKNK